MKLEVEAISQDTVKPSFPTPPHLHHYQLSFLDQLQPLVLMPLVHFYPKYSDTNLTNIEQNCNDEGAHYVEAKANCKLSEFLEDPIPGELNKFLPYELDEVNELPAAVQVTFFNCGGLVIGVLMSHRIIDALSFILFLNSWAAIARGHGNIVTPPMDSATLFPPQELSGLNMNIGITKDNIVTKRFVFDASAIGSIREKYSSDDKSIEYPRPTRVEALSAFIWSRFMASTQSKPDPNKIYKIVHALNLRTRTDPPLSFDYFGNITRFAMSVPSRDTEESFHGIIKPMREAIQKIDGDFVKMLQQGDVYLKYMKENISNFVKGELVTLSFTNLQVSSI
uniref:Vinorine synthase n=1 Tax=Quercus lobata TaxID=97700 RepID=A0A7N2L851_QUELO